MAQIEGYFIQNIFLDEYFDNIALLYAINILVFGSYFLSEIFTKNTNMGMNTPGKPFMLYFLRL